MNSDTIAHTIVTADELRNAGFIVTRSANRVLVRIQNRRVTVDEVMLAIEAAELPIAEECIYRSKYGGVWVEIEN